MCLKIIYFREMVFIIFKFKSSNDDDDEEDII